MATEKEQLDKMNDIELVAYWNILQTPGIKVDGGKTERHIPIVSRLLDERNIPYREGKRTVVEGWKVGKEVADGSLDHLIYDERSPRP